jgi:sigma-B regulation protein RsbU (phosphoserine phosphatase)
MSRAGLWPATRFARVACYILGIDLLFYALKRTLELAGSSYGESLGFWVTLLSFVAFILFLILAYRWMKANMLWRLRNRLIVTYVFIGVIPAALLVTISLETLKVLAEQFANFVVTADLNDELRSLEVVNAAMEANLTSKLESGSPLTAELLATLRRQNATHAPRLVCAWMSAGAKPVCEGEGDTNGLAPSKLQANHTAAIVLDGGNFYLRAALRGRIKDTPFTLVSSQPLDQQFLASIAPDMGEVTLSAAVPGSASPVRTESAAGAPKFTTTPGPPSSSTRVRAVSAGVLAPPTSRIDPAIEGAAPLTVLDWATGKEADQEKSGTLQVRTRPSILFAKLFGAGDFDRFASGWGLIILIIIVVFAIMVALALVVGTTLTRTVTRAIAQLYLATRHINQGDFSHRIPIASQDQLATLAHSFNSMSESLQKLMQEQKEKQKLENELVIAQEVQAQLFPRQISQLPNLEVHGFCRPARTVSGDYYDFLRVDPNRMVMAVGDVSGKGISAALLMATIHSAVRAYSLEGIPILRESNASRNDAAAGGLALAVQGVEVSTAALLTLLNHQLYESTPAEKYATMFLSFYDGRERKLTYSNAGHLPPIILGHNGALRRLDCGGTVVGLFEQVSYEERVVTLAEGDIFLAYSDGITEPENDYGEFGEQRLIDLVWENRQLPLARISEIVTAAVDDWIGAGEQPDDVTLVLARAR